MATYPSRAALSLGASKNASPQHRAKFAAFPSAMSSASSAAMSLASSTSSDTAATEKQTAAANKTSTELAAYNPDAQLAITLNVALMEEVDKYSAGYAKALSSIANNTRQLLNLLRESVQDGPTATTELATIDEIWSELEQLLHAAKEARVALPKFLDQQKENMSLFHNSMINEAMHESQAELALQYKKVNLQHSLILEHQQAFQDYRANTNTKLKELKSLEERASRLTLDKGLLKKELEDSQQQLKQALLNKAHDAEKSENTQKEIDTLLSSNNGLAVEVDNLRKYMSELQKKTKTGEQKTANRHEEELHKKTEKVKQEQKKAIQLQIVITNLESRNSDTLKELVQLRKSNVTLQKQFDHQSHEHADEIALLNEKCRKLTALTINIERSQEQTAELKQRAGKLDGLEKANAELSSSKASIQEEIKGIKHKLVGANGDIKRLSEKLEALEEENEELEVENNSLIVKAGELKLMTSGLANLRSENAKLSATVQELQSKPAAANGDNAALVTVVKEKKALSSELDMTKKDLAQSRKSVEEWSTLAKKSYKEYKDMLPTYKDAELHRQACVEKEKEIDKLKLELEFSNVKTSADINVADDSIFWKSRYESLLATVG